MKETLSVCIVDDDDMFLQSLKHHLQEKLNDVIQIRLFHTGESFLKGISEQKADIVILDYILNGLYPYAMDGHSVLRKIKQTNPETAVIMLSGQDKIEVALGVIKDGAYDYIIKNDNTFLKMQAVLKNVIKSILVSKRLSRYKRWFARALVVFSIMIIINILIKIVFYNQL